MEFYILMVACFIHGFQQVAHARYDGVRRMDLYYDYWGFQNVVQALNTTKVYFFYGYNYQTPNEPYVEDNPQPEKIEKKCISFKKDNLSATGVQFTRRYEEGEVEKSDTFSGTFYKGRAIGKNNEHIAIRDTPNIVEVRSTTGEPHPTNYTLVYANYKDCSIFRLGESDENAETKCLVLLSASIVKKFKIPKDCHFVYNNTCGQKDELKVVFQNTCKVEENPLGC